MDASTTQELNILKLELKIHKLEERIRDQDESIKESTRLLIKTRPHQRPPISSDKKMLCAAANSFKCANPYNSCPLFKTGDGTFDESLFEIHHITSWSQCYRTNSNIVAVCPMCHSRLTREERSRQFDAANQQEDCSTCSTTRCQNHCRYSPCNASEQPCQP